MAESREYATLVKHSKELEIALSSDTDILHSLNEEGFITDSVYYEVRDSPAKKSYKVVNAIRNKVKLNPQNYHKLLHHFLQNRRSYGDIADILDNEYSPKPTSGDVEALFPYLSTDMKPHERDNLIYRLKDEASRIQDHFISLEVCLKRTLKQSELSSKDVISVLTKKHPNLQTVFRECKTIDEIFEEGEKYWSYFDYDPIQSLIICLFDEKHDLRTKLTKYFEHFKGYASRLVAECPSIIHNGREEDEKVLVFKIEDMAYQELTTNDLKLLCFRLNSAIGSYHLSLLSTSNGCIQLTFRTNFQIEDKKFELSKEQQESLRNVGVISVSYGDQEYNLKYRLSSESQEDLFSQDTHVSSPLTSSEIVEHPAARHKELVRQKQVELEDAIVGSGEVKRLASEMNAAGIMVDDDHDKITPANTDRESARLIVKTLRNKVGTNPKYFENFMEILRSRSEFRDILDVLETTAGADVDTTPLDLDDLADVLTELEPVEFRYFEIGTMLHLRHHVLNRIRSLNSVSFSMRMSEMITEWLKLNYNTKRFGPPTWNALVIAVAKGPGGADEACARDIANKHRVSRVSKPVIEDPISESSNSSPFPAGKQLETAPVNMESHNEMEQEVQSTSLPVESQVTTTDSLCPQPKRKKDSMYGPTLMENIADNIIGTGMRSDVQCAGGTEEGSNIKDTIIQEHVKEGIHSSQVKTSTEEAKSKLTEDDASYKTLYSACKRDDVSQVQKLINEQKDDVSTKNYNNTSLHEAAINMKKWNEEVDLPLIDESYCDTNIKGAFGRSLLHHACYGGHVSLVRKLINEHKVDVNSRDDSNNTPLHVAALNGKEEVALALINEFDCDINIKGQFGSSLLHKACEGGNVSLVRKLINEHKADVNAENDNNSTPLHVAALAGNEEVVLALINEFGCNTNVKGQFGMSPLDYACVGGPVSFVRKLINEHKADVNSRDNENSTPLHMAAFAGNEEVVLALINEFGCDSNIKGAFGMSLLHQACRGGHVSLVRKLIKEHKADVNSRDDGNNTPLHVAALNGKEEVALSLINEFGCDINIKGAIGRSVLHFASGFGNVSLVRKLIKEHKADVSSRDDENSTSLHLAAFRGNEEVALALINEFGCDTNIKGVLGNSLLHLACKGGNVSLVKKLMIEHKSDVNARNDQNNTPVLVAALSGNEGVALSLINEFGCDTNIKGQFGMSLLHFACHGGNVSLVRKLINEHEADVNAEDDDNNTPLHVAAFYGKEEVALSLINEFNCDTNIKGAFGRSLLHNACEGGNVSLVRKLINEHKVDVNARDDDNYTPLEIAVLAGKEEIVLALMSCD